MKVLAFGEVLWDIFEEDYKIGGAPFNFCGHLTKLGAQTSMISAVGSDELCDITLKKVRASGIDDSLISVNSFMTGVCQVTRNAEGQPTYDLKADTAYDNILVDDKSISYIKQKEFDAFYFGTLAQRSQVSQSSLIHLLETCQFREIFCDLNLRSPFYNNETIKLCLRYATIFKINRDECKIIAETVLHDFRVYEDSIEYYRKFCAALAKQYDLKIVLITLDRDGAIVYNRLQNLYVTSGHPESKAVSTVGAGDSFSACFLYNYLNGNDMADSALRAGILSDFVVTKTEAVPDYPDNLLSKIR